MRRVVVLPAPALGPSRPKTSPAGTENETASTARNSRPSGKGKGSRDFLHQYHDASPIAGHWFPGMVVGRAAWYNRQVFPAQGASPHVRVRLAGGFCSLGFLCMGATPSAQFSERLHRVCLPTGRTPCWPPSTCFSQAFNPSPCATTSHCSAYWLLCAGVVGGAAPLFRCAISGSSSSSGRFSPGITFLEIGVNVHDFQSFGSSGFWYLQAGPISTLVLARLHHPCAHARVPRDRSHDSDGTRTPGTIGDRSRLCGGSSCQRPLHIPWPFPYEWSAARWWRLLRTQPPPTASWKRTTGAGCCFDIPSRSSAREFALVEFVLLAPIGLHSSGRHSARCPRG